MPTAAVRAVGIDLTASARRLSLGHEGHLYADGLTMPTAAVGIDGGMPTASLCRRLFPGCLRSSSYADGPDKKPSA